MIEKHTSVVIPVYNSGTILYELASRLIQVLENISTSYEIILVDDGSLAETKVALKNIAEKYPAIKILTHEKNLGQHVSILHGLIAANAEWIIVMDDDLQDSPEEIKTLFQHATEKNKCIVAIRKNNQFSFFRKSSSYLFNALLSFASGKNFSHASGNFGLYHSSLIQRIKTFPEHLFYFPVAIRKVAQHITYIETLHAKRSEGKSTYTFTKMIKLCATAFKAAKYKL